MISQDDIDAMDDQGITAPRLHDGNSLLGLRKIISDLEGHLE